MRIPICDGVALVASTKTCERILEAFRCRKELHSLSLADFDGDWYDFDYEWEYLQGREELLLGLIEPTLEAIECFGRI